MPLGSAGLPPSIIALFPGIGRAHEVGAFTVSHASVSGDTEGLLTGSPGLAGILSFFPEVKPHPLESVCTRLNPSDLNCPRQSGFCPDESRASELSPISVFAILTAFFDEPWLRMPPASGAWLPAIEELLRKKVAAPSSAAPPPESPEILLVMLVFSAFMLPPVIWTPPP